MRIRSLLIAVGALVITPNLASAAVMTTFEFSGSTTTNGSTTNLGPGFPAGGAFRQDGSNAHAVSVGQGEDDPFVFSNGAVSAGSASASSEVRVTIEVTNDSAVAQNATWNFLIFAGGIGVTEANLFSSGCNATALDQCDSYDAPNGDTLASASLLFDVALDGATIFGGDISASDSGVTSTFNGIALDGFGLAAGNSNFATWNDTSFTLDLGELAAGETTTIEFYVLASVISDSDAPCFFDQIDQVSNCPLAMAGFGDPGGMNGGIIMRSFALSSIEESIELEPVPVPGAIWLFATAIGAAAGARRLKKKQSG